ncbi:MAG: hypothetical protein V2I67_16705 [Thermoanaerobaculales bacterium]|jgi:hypothetical protein|nr:hypothetical protein [Thermoanaerobaculales bacterium]
MIAQNTRFNLAAGLVLAAFTVVTTASSIVHASSVDGYIYGTVETRSGSSYSGILRWDDEEAFWDDLFHSAKGDLPYSDYAEKPEVDEDLEWWRRMVKTISNEMGVHHESRVVAVRFGDLREIRPEGGGKAVLVLRDGSELQVEGYANDVSASVVVHDAKPGRVEVPWKKIERIVFQETPGDADPGSFRLRGTVTTDDGRLEGFIQWDNEECLSTDLLDGDEDDRRLSLAMGEIRSIEKISSRRALVVMKDGAEHRLSGTNDVNDDIRGIHVEDPRYGRVEVSWDGFREVVFDDPGSSGPGYGSYGPGRRLSGTVRLKGGDWRRGNLVFDLDEEWSWEMLDGEADELDYTIPFAQIASIAPAGSRGSVVTLRNGLELELEGSHDVDVDNSGVVVVPTKGGEPVHVVWHEIDVIEFD